MVYICAGWQRYVLHKFIRLTVHGCLDCAAWLTLFMFMFMICTIYYWFILPPGWFLYTNFMKENSILYCSVQHVVYHIHNIDIPSTPLGRCCRYNNLTIVEKWHLSSIDEYKWSQQALNLLSIRIIARLPVYSKYAHS